MKLTTYLLASAALIAVSLTSAQAQTSTQNQNQRFSIGGYEIRPLIGIEFDESGVPLNRRPRRPGPTVNSAPAARPGNPAVTTPHTVVNQPRPQQGTGAPQARPTYHPRPQTGNGAPSARPSTRPRPQAGTGAPAARPMTRPRPQTGNGAPAARPSNRPRPQAGTGAPRPRGPIVRDHRQPNRLQHTSVVPRPRTSQRQVRDHRNYQGKSLGQRRNMKRFK